MGYTGASLRGYQELSARQYWARDIIEFQKYWYGRNREEFGMALTSRVKAGQITTDLYNDARDGFYKFGMKFYSTELVRTQKYFQVPSRVPKSRLPALERNIKVVEVGIGQKDFLDFPKVAWDAGFDYELRDCDKQTVIESQEELERRITVNGVIAFDTTKVIKFGMLHNLVSGSTPYTWPNGYFGLGVFVRVLQHNKKWIRRILPGIHRKAMEGGRVIVAHPCRDDNRGVIYSDTEPYSRGEIRDGFNVGFLKHQWWDILHEETCPFDVETYRWMVLGNPRLIGDAY